MAIAFAMPAQAVEWRIEPSVGASAIYSDNANQSENDPGRPDQPHRLAGRHRAFGGIAAGRGDLAVSACREWRASASDNSNDLYHNLNASGKAELVEDFLFVDADARISQELISLLGSPADPAVNANNRATTGSYSISPYIKKRFGTFADAQARYTLSGALFENDVASDLLGNELVASINSGSRFSALNWGLNYSFRDVSDRNGGVAGDTSYTYERADLALGYALTRKFRLIGNVGQ